MILVRRRALAVLAWSALAACSRRPGGASSGARVISISPSTTEAMFAIGAGASLVGRSRYCDTPPDALKLPVVGGFSDPDLEAILALRPTLVVGAQGPAGAQFEDKLEQRRIATFFPRTESIAEIEAMITKLGELLDRRDGARAVVADIEAKKRGVEAAVRSRGKKRVALLFDVAPIVAAGPGGFPDEMITLAGGDNVVKAGGPYPTIDLERLVALDPEVLLDGASVDAESNTSRVLALADKPGWRDLSAVKSGRVVPLALDVVLRPGPRIGDGLVAVARAIFGANLAVEVR